MMIWKDLKGSDSGVVRVTVLAFALESVQKTSLRRADAPPS
jgi:hypothetical protein